LRILQLASVWGAQEMTSVNNSQPQFQRPSEGDLERVYSDLAKYLASVSGTTDIASQRVIPTTEVANQLASLNHSSATVYWALRQGFEQGLIKKSVVRQTQQKTRGQIAVEAKPQVLELEGVVATAELFLRCTPDRSTSLISNDLVPNSVVLALSGGGLRATLFHLGILVYLAKIGRLGDVKGMVSVSGGSILAAHFVKDWAKAKSDFDGFTEVAASLVRFTRTNLRDSVLTPWVWSRLNPLQWKRRFGRTARLELAYRKHYGETTFGALQRPDCPPVAFAATDSEHQERIAFTVDKVLRFPLGSPPKSGNSFVANAAGVRLSVAVAASSCFPLAFRRMELNYEDLGLNYNEFKESLVLSDGGITDNLGTEVLLEFLSRREFLAEMTLIGDAERPQWSKPKKNQIALVELIGIAVSELARKRIEAELHHTCSLISLRKRVSDNFGLSFEAQTQLMRFRTDLDAPTWQEIHALILHGSAAAADATGWTTATNASAEIPAAIAKIIEKAGGPAGLTKPSAAHLRTSWRRPIGRLVGHMLGALSVVGSVLLILAMLLFQLLPSNTVDGKIRQLSERAIARPSHTDSIQAIEDGRQAKADEPRNHGPERARNVEPSESALKTGARRGSLPPAGPMSPNSAESELADKIRNWIVDAGTKSDVHEAIRTLEKGVTELKLNELPDGDLDGLEAGSLHYALLSACYESAYNYDQALDANEHEFELLQRIYHVDPNKATNKATSRIAGQPTDDSVVDDVLHNRLRWPFLMHAARETKLNPTERQRAQESIGHACEFLRKSKTNRVERASFWLIAALAYWLNADAASAELTMVEAQTVAGPPLPVEVESKEKQRVLATCYVLHAAIQAETGQGERAWESLKKAGLYSDALPEHPRVMGYVQLLIARSARSKNDAIRALEEAIRNFKKDGCAFCRYDLSCALSRRSEFENDSERAKLLNEARGHLLFVLNESTIRRIPFEPESEAVLKDPFLQLLASDADVIKAVHKFKWQPHELGMIPPMMVDFARLQLWYAGLPMKRARFTRLNGDDRVLSVKAQ
jgi:predicted acylesterase/phospholipase RssA/tetratricopeptide (TPR) repeat protein